METLNTLIVFLTGVFLRLALPVAATLVAVYFLRRLDVRWQKEAGEQGGIRVEKPECWKINGCSAETRRNCAGFNSPQPCWQAMRFHNGYLREECLTCQVLRGAPVPAGH